jgi:hypothetical protein
VSNLVKIKYLYLEGMKIMVTFALKDKILKTPSSGEKMIQYER